MQRKDVYESVNLECVERKISLILDMVMTVRFITKANFVEYEKYITGAYDKA